MKSIGKSITGGVVLLIIFAFGILGRATVSSASDNRVSEVDMNHLDYSKVSDLRMNKSETLENFLKSDTQKNIGIYEDGRVTISDINFVSIVETNSCGVYDACWLTGQAPYANVGFRDTGTANGNWPARSMFRSKQLFSSIYATAPDGTKLKAENLALNSETKFYNASGNAILTTGTAVVLWT